MNASVRTIMLQIVLLIGLVHCSGAEPPAVDSASNGQDDGSDDPSENVRDGGGRADASRRDSGGNDSGRDDAGSAREDAGSSCDETMKTCGATCVGLDDPDFGCGATGCAPCALSDATATCESGACAIKTCDLNHDDCDNVATNGCEANLATDHEHCGKCGTACSSDEVCSGGACTASCTGSKIACSGSCVDTSSDANHCGSCAACPGAGETSAAVACARSACSFACKGEDYDVNQNASDGCEVSDTAHDNHAEATATAGGSYSCVDTLSQLSLSGMLVSDDRLHTPAVPDFDSTSGSAPDWFQIFATGGSCVNDVALQLQLSGSEYPTCYRLTAITNLATYSCATDASGHCSFSTGISSYSDNSDIYVAVSKTCAASQVEAVSYSVTGHL